MQTSLTLPDYIDRAKDRQKIKSDRALDRLFGFKGAAVHFWRHAKAWPSPASMRKLAEFAGEDPEIAVMQLGIWTNPPEAANVYRSILNKLSGLAAALVVFAYANGANAALSAGNVGGISSGNSSQVVYIMENIFRALIVNGLRVAGQFFHNLQNLNRWVLFPVRPLRVT